jgi:hypothetical protein
VRGAGPANQGGAHALSPVVKVEMREKSVELLDLGAEARIRNA